MDVHRTRLVVAGAAAACAALLVLVVLAGPYRLGLADHRVMSLGEQQAVSGGAWLQNYMCMSPPPGSPCNNADTNCSAGGDYCSEVQMEGALCASLVDYKNPTRCVQGGILWCEDRDNQGVEIECYSYRYCYCSGEPYTCSVMGDLRHHYVPICQHAASPP